MVIRIGSSKSCFCTRNDGAWVKGKRFLKKLLKDLEMCTVDSVGISMGFPSAWNPNSINMIPFCHLQGSCWKDLRRVGIIL